MGSKDESELEDYTKDASTDEVVSATDKHLSSGNFKTARDEYVRSPQNIGLRELSRKWNIPLRTLTNISSREGWVAQREKYQAELVGLTDAKVAELVSESEADMVARHIKQLKSLQAMVGDYLSSDTRNFSSKDAALNAYLNAMKLERLSRGMKAGDRIDTETEDDISALSLIKQRDAMKAEQARLALGGEPNTADELENEKAELKARLAFIEEIEKQASMPESVAKGYEDELRMAEELDYDDIPDELLDSEEEQD